MQVTPIHAIDIEIPDTGCAGCKDALDFDFTFAFQPIVDVGSRTVYAYEALVRGPNGEGAFSVLEKLDDRNRYRFDQECRIRSITLAQRLGLDTRLSINFLPNAVYRPDICIRTTIEAAERCGFPLEKIIFEVTEGEHVREPERLLNIFRHYRDRGFLTAIDDFGAGYAGLTLLTDFQPNLLKLDMHLVRDIDSNPVKQAVVNGILLTNALLGVQVIAEGIETLEEATWLWKAGVRLMQGYYFGRPAFEALPTPQNWLPA